MVEEQKKIVIVDDHPLFREGLKALIGRSSEFVVVGEAGCGADAFDLASQVRPDIMLVDISMPGKNGIQIIRELGKIMPAIRFIVVSMHTNVDYVVEALQAGASGYMVKDSTSDSLLPGLATVAKGEVYLDSALSGKVVDKLLKVRKEDSGPNDDPYQNLTAREQEVMRLLVDGIATKKVAERLYISPKTVENHRANLMKKLNLSSSIDLVRYSARLGLIDLNTWVG